MDLFGELEWRGLVYAATDGAKERLARPNMTAYVGFDPTASSLHVGSLLPIMVLARLQRFGHSPIAVVGGGTGLIGDPSGKTVERQLLTVECVERNVEGLRRQLSRFLDFDAVTNPARLVNNAEWLMKLSAVDFMRDIGKHFTVNYMLAKESVKRRVAGEEGISYTEFSYLLLQAYDFLKLHETYHCTVQMGGSDQWGNITAGIELIRRMRPAGAERAYGLVFPLLTTAPGTKFGKTEAGSLWLDSTLTMPYEFYQFWLNTDDRDAVRYLKFFTFLDAAQISELEAAGTREPEQRHTQRALAREVTGLVHGAQAVRDAEVAAEKLFSGKLRELPADLILQAYKLVPSKSVPRRTEGWRIASLLTDVGVTSSNSEATRLIRSGGIYVNDERVTDEKARLSPEQAIDGQLFVIRKGKKDNFLIRIQQGLT